MRILLCNERFIFRFGVDRVLIMLGQKFKTAGHEVTVMANRFDLPVVNTFAKYVITAPIEFAAYPDLNEWTAMWLADHWPKIMADAGAPNEPYDIAMIGGWPFFLSIPALQRRARRVIFLDYGAVPLNGYPEETKTVLRKLARLRQAGAPEASAIIAGSDFLADTQTRPDSRGRVMIHTILAGSDHIDATVWQVDDVAGVANAQRIGLGIAQKLKADGKKTLLNLGRWEPHCYKNSAASYDILRTISAEHPQTALMILADPKTADIPTDLRARVHPIGFPDDQELLEIMRLTDVGLSVSLWEGHNLPLSEMQWLDRPALAFHLAAHPEVVLDPWYLCRTTADMAAKTADILAGRGPTAAQRADWQKKHRAYFTWDRAARDYLEFYQRVLDTPQEAADAAARLQIIIDVTNSARDPANSGVIRVTRRFARQLQNNLAPRFAVWDATDQRYVLLNEHEAQVLSRYNGPLTPPQHVTPPDAPRRPLETSIDPPFNDTWLILSEVMPDVDARRRWAQQHGIRTAALFYDAIPVLRPDLVSDIVRRGHGDYMQSLSQVDVVSAISAASAHDLHEFWLDRALPSPRLVPNLLPGEFGGSARITTPPTAPQGKIKMLCVSTIEPRKNHLGLLAALEQLSASSPDLDWELTLVGNRYAGADDLYQQVQAAAQRNPRIRLAGIVDDATLRRLYEESSFTIYPSLIEGFGMPIVESLWHARPCICSSSGVMGELATEGGCIAVDVTDPAELAKAIADLATDPVLYERLATEATRRRAKTWDDYAAEWLNLLVNQTLRIDPAALQTAAPAATSADALLFPFRSAPTWSLNPTQRLALAAILTRLKPRCAIALAADAATLALMHQSCDMIFAVGDSPDLQRQTTNLRKISLLAGAPADVLSLLLAELDSAGIAPDFILATGPAECQAITQTLPHHTPRSPILILLRQATPAATSPTAWQESPHTQWIDQNFAPGADLTAIYLTPRPREGPLKITTPSSPERANVISRV